MTDGNKPCCTETAQHGLGKHCYSTYMYSSVIQSKFSSYGAKRNTYHTCIKPSWPGNTVELSCGKHTNYREFEIVHVPVYILFGFQRRHGAADRSDESTTIVRILCYPNSYNLASVSRQATRTSHLNAYVSIIHVTILLTGGSIRIPFKRTLQKQLI